MSLFDKIIYGVVIILIIYFIYKARQTKLSDAYDTTQSEDVLHIGSRGDQVIKLQKTLNELIIRDRINQNVIVDETLMETGVFGDPTLKALQAYTNQDSIHVDDISELLNQ